MARGYLYEISDNLNNYPISSLDIESMYRYCGIEFEYIENISNNETMENRKNLIELLEQYGFTIGSQEDNNTTLAYVSATITAKKNYFQSRLRQLKEQIKDITLREFANETSTIRYIQEAIEDKYSDAVSFNGTFYSFDDFIRQMKPNTKYYVGDICLMH